ncbi:MAG: aminotransferase class I/II-fold pyridoxal phosphate-dependent enzyme [Flavobacterium sp.]|nr:aminotransferase class I/II-fold pyridoxal phosphate-dependent enzyme [Pedobacter sp.]
MNKKISLSSPHMGGSEFLFLKNAFDSNWIAPLGPHVDGFEKDLATYLGNGVHVAALSSGTASLHLALVILGVKQNDEVICQSLTFSASANPIMYQGATPVFVDSESQTWNMSPDLLEIAIKDRLSKGKKPKAIIVVHLYGMPAEMDRIMEVSRKYQIPVIEDAAEALGSTYKGRKLGTFGDMAILSFNGNKIITTSGGGALVSKNEDWIIKSRFLATQARDIAPHYQHSQVGYNYRMSNICASIGRGQMEVLPLRIYQRRKNFTHYTRLLSNISNIQFQIEPDDTFFSNHWLSAITLEDEEGKITNDMMRLALAEDNIEVRPVWKPMHMQPVFSEFPFYGDGTAEHLFKVGLCLPSGSNLTEYEIRMVISKIKNCFSTSIV